MDYTDFRKQWHAYNYRTSSGNPSLPLAAARHRRFRDYDFHKWQASLREIVGVALVVLLLFSPGCYFSHGKSQAKIAGSTMGTTFTVKLHPRPSCCSFSVSKEVVYAELDAVDSRMSTYRDDSELSRFNASKSTDWFDVSPETAEVVTEAIRVGKLSDGAYDVTVEPLVRLWNFGSDAKDVDAVPSEEQIEHALQTTGLEHLSVRLDPPAIKKDIAELHVDLSSIAKGYAVDRVAYMLDQVGCKNYMVEVGGEVRARGHNSEGQPWQIAIERPTDGPKQVHGVLPLTDRAMATSGDYRNYFEKDGRRYSHLIDPRSGRPITHRLASVTVLANRCRKADALATALSILGPEQGMQLAEREGIAAAFLIRKGDGFVERHTSTFPAITGPQEAQSNPLLTFAAAFVALALFMLILAVGTVLRRRKPECTCKKTARIMAAKTPPRPGNQPDANADSPFVILNNNSDGGCDCGNDR